MSEWRQDPFTGRWRIIAEGRSARPDEYSVRAPPPAADPGCPFCEGNEARTPPESAALRPRNLPADGPGWTARAIPNRFPTVSRDAPPSMVPTVPPFERAAALGVHEVIVESPRHAPDLAYLAPEHLASLFRFFRDRVGAARTVPSIASVLLFENRGPDSGGTLPHPHAQLVATRRVPSRIEEERAAFSRGDLEGRPGCRLEAVVESERRAGERVVHDDERFVAFVPFAAEYPYETWIVPRRHSPTFAEADDRELESLARLLPAVIRALDAVRGRVSYNWFVHEAGPPARGADPFHWHVELAPRIVRPDGYELGSGVSVNPVGPEAAASDLRPAVAEALGGSAQ